MTKLCYIDYVSTNLCYAILCYTILCYHCRSNISPSVCKGNNSVAKRDAILLQVGSSLRTDLNTCCRAARMSAGGGSSCPLQLAQDTRKACVWLLLPSSTSGRLLSTYHVVS